MLVGWKWVLWVLNMEWVYFQFVFWGEMENGVSVDFSAGEDESSEEVWKCLAFGAPVCSTLFLFVFGWNKNAMVVGLVLFCIFQVSHSSLQIYWFQFFVFLFLGFLFFVCGFRYISGFNFNAMDEVCSMYLAFTVTILGFSFFYSFFCVCLQRLRNRVYIDLTKINH